MNQIAIICAALALSTFAHAEDDCLPADKVRETVAHADGKWIEMTESQWQFMRGAYVVNPMTPARLPFGDKGVMVTSKQGGTTLIFFMDGDLACDMMSIPKEAEQVLLDVGSGAVVHHPKEQVKGEQNP